MANLCENRLNFPEGKDPLLYFTCSLGKGHGGRHMALGPHNIWVIYWHDKNEALKQKAKEDCCD